VFDAVVAPFDHAYVNGAVPVAFTVADPSVAPLQLVFVVDAIVAVTFPKTTTEIVFDSPA